MGTLNNLLTIAKNQIGVVESPPNSNNVLYNTWYYGRKVSGSNYAWCMAFCQWVYHQANVRVPIITASCTTLLDAAKRNNCFVNNRNLAPGDLVLYNFDGVTTNVATHCGIVVSVDKIKIKAIEGNTSTANDTNGGAVMLRERLLKYVIGAFRPRFDTEEDLDMTKAEFLKSLTDEEAYSLLEKAMNHVNKQKEPSWSTKEGHWARATKDKVVDGSRPEAFMRRDECIAILGRKGLV